MSNFTVVTGNIGSRSPLTKVGDNQVVNLSVASSNGKETTWFKVAIWGDYAAKMDQYLTVGKNVTFQGVLEVDEYGNPKVYQSKDGSWRASYVVKLVGSVQLNGGGRKDEAVEVEDTDDMPF